VAFHEEGYGSEVHVQPVFGHDDAEGLLVGGRGGSLVFIGSTADDILSICAPGITRFRSRTPDYKALRVFTGLELLRSRTRRSLS
jgi:hypothetical protein